MNKVCTKCKRELHAKNFATDATRKDGKHPHCSTCRRVYGRVWQKLVRNIPTVREKLKEQSKKSYRKHNEKRKAEMRARTPDYKKESFIKSVYGITLKDYDDMFKKQGGVCFICGQKETRKNKYTGVCRLHIDHDHKTGKVRGLLCHSCNFGISAFMDSAQLLERAIEYLRIGGALP